MQLWIPSDVQSLRRACVDGRRALPGQGPLRTYDVSAINVEITLNMWLDFYPGYMYVLDGEYRASCARKKRKNKDARRGRVQPGRSDERVAESGGFSPSSFSR
ncbi:MAG: hypothetical protein IPM88_20405 [Nitrospira sp.]|nr:hypothetical protein [Nitrospira sp.]